MARDTIDQHIEMTPQFDISPFLDQDEGQHFDRKSLFKGPENAKQARDRRNVRDQVAEYVAAFANAEGGVLILGIEDDRSITGHQLPSTALQTLLKTPRVRLDPPQPDGFVVAIEGHELIVFDVPAADVPVQVVGDGFPFRTGDQTVQVRESQIHALKLQGMVESWESRPTSCTLDDLDSQLLAKARQGAGLSSLTDEEYLLKRKLADRRRQGIVLRRAAELLFARPEAGEHPNAGVRLFRVIGSERRTGPEHNVEEYPRIEGNLSVVIEEAGTVISSLLRRPSRLVGNQFREAPEYPDFAWREALLNTIAHRDYRVEGSSTEVWLFEDRMEVVSPGNLAGNLTTDELLTLKRVHRSRNPRIVRVLVDLGFARDQGEGIPRMFAEMEDAFLPLPDITATTLSVTVTLRNTLTLNTIDREFIAGLGSLELSDAEFRALLRAHRKGRIDNAHMRALVGFNTLKASDTLRGLRDRNLLVLHSHGANSYYTLAPVLTGRNETEPSILYQGELPSDIREAIDQLGTRPRKKHIRSVILAICEQGNWVTAAALASFLNFRQKNLTTSHLTPMLKSGQLEWRFPDKPNHPSQAYRATT